MPNVALRIEVGLSEGLMRQLAEGLIDLGGDVLAADPPRLRHPAPARGTSGAGLDHAARASQWDQTYVFVDWGPEYRAAHSQAFPDQPTQAVSVSLGALGLQHILANGGFGYFPMRVVRPYIQAGTLFRVANAPEFRRPAFIAYPAEEEQSSWLLTAVRGLRHVAALDIEE